jgi:hypothetical protein
MESNGGRSVGIEDVNAALNAKDIPTDCPVCRWTVWGTTDRLALVPMDERPRSLEKAVEAVCMVCEHCGFAKLHIASVLMDN